MDFAQMCNLTVAVTVRGDRQRSPLKMTLKAEDSTRTSVLQYDRDHFSPSPRVERGPGGEVKLNADGLFEQVFPSKSRCVATKPHFERDFPLKQGLKGGRGVG
jgi:hypothetical protein